MQMTWSDSHQRPSDDWQWAVGESPLSPTSPSGLVFSGPQVDALHRNYGVTALRQATTTYNRAVGQLQRQHTADSNQITDSQVKDLNAKLAASTGMITSFFEMLSAGEFQRLCDQISVLEATVNEFATHVHELIEEAKDLECRSDIKGQGLDGRDVGVPSMIYIMCATICGSAVLIRLLRQRTYKTKLN